MRRRCGWVLFAGMVAAACDGSAFVGETFVHVGVYGVGTVEGGNSTSSIVCSDRSLEMCTGDFSNATEVPLTAVADVPGHQFRVWDNLLVEAGSEAFGEALYCPAAGTTSPEVSFTTGAKGARYGCLAVFGDDLTPAPVITAIAPSSGQIGDSFKILGTDLGNPLIRIGAYEDAVVAQPGSTSTPTMIATTVPDGAQSGRVTVITPGGITISPQDFIVTTEPGGDCSVDVATSTATVSPNPRSVGADATTDHNLTVTVPIGNSGSDAFDVTGGSVQFTGGGVCQLAAGSTNVTAKSIASGASTTVTLTLTASITTPPGSGSCSWMANITLQTSCGDRYSSLTSPFVANY